MTIQQQLDCATQKSLDEMRLKRKKLESNTIYMQCTLCYGRFDYDVMVNPYWWNSGGTVCPDCYTRIYSKYKVQGKNHD